MKIVGDITYIPTAGGWLYLASWLDLATREVIGYSMAITAPNSTSTHSTWPPRWAAWSPAA
ncbi:hypothetical protein ACWGI8_33040 [Streptomyces sp. NPDC054841]